MITIKLCYLKLDAWSQQKIPRSQRTKIHTEIMIETLGLNINFEKLHIE